MVGGNCHDRRHLSKAKSVRRTQFACAKRDFRRRVGPDQRLQAHQRFRRFMSPPQPLLARPGGKLTGIARVPADKSMSHLALILGALAVGRSHLRGLPDTAGVRATAAALRALGATVIRHADGLWTVDGVGVGGLLEPARALDLDAAGVGPMLGLVATHPLTAIVTDDGSRADRSMARVIQPLEMMGAQFTGRRGGFLPLAVTGAALPMPLDYRLAVASAAVKSAILLAALNTPGTTAVFEPHPTPDHAERMLRRFGARVTTEAGRIEIEGQPELTPATLDLPADPALAAVPMVAALVVAGSDITLANVGLNPLRTGLFATLKDMGAQIEILDARDAGGEPVGDLRVRASRLAGITVPAGREIEDYPILAVAAASATGTTVMQGVGDIEAIARGLAACGVAVTVDGDRLTVHGAGGPVPGGARILAGADPRLGAAFLVLGLGAQAPVAIDDAAAIDTSFPDFAGLMRGLGADISAGTI
jgi:3-phosphoshikimate 1-carboxyvinyltransferase